MMTNSIFLIRMQKKKKESKLPLTFLYNDGRSVSEKGKNPAIMTKRITPQDQISAAEPS